MCGQRCALCELSKVTLLRSHKGAQSPPRPPPPEMAFVWFTPGGDRGPEIWHASPRVVSSRGGRAQGLRRGRTSCGLEETDGHRPLRQAQLCGSSSPSPPQASFSTCWCCSFVQLTGACQVLSAGINWTPRTANPGCPEGGPQPSSPRHPPGENTGLSVRLSVCLLARHPAASPFLPSGFLTSASSA